MIRSYSKKALSILFPYFSYFFPKKKSLFVFYQKFNQGRFSSNIKALLLHIHENHPEIQIAFLGSKSVPQFINTNIKDLSGLHLWTQYYYLLKAKYIIVDSTSYDLFRKGNFSLIQLWHGTGFKNIGLLNQNNTKKRNNEIKQIYNKYKLVVATSQKDLERKNASFGNHKARITGSPRNDVFFEKKEYFDNLKSTYNLTSYSQIITYVPTFRDFETYPPFTLDFWKKLNDILLQNNAIFVIKKHPSDKHLSIPKDLENIKDLTTEVTDVQSLLVISDLLISDYSGIMSDFAITGRPIMVYPYDLELYKKKCRSFYYNLDHILPRPYIKDEEDFLLKIKNQSWITTSEYQKHYTTFKELFHKHLDGNSTKRVYEEIVRLDNE